MFLLHSKTSTPNLSLNRSNARRFLTTSSTMLLRTHYRCQELLGSLWSNFSSSQRHRQIQWKQYWGSMNASVARRREKRQLLVLNWKERESLLINLTSTFLASFPKSHSRDLKMHNQVKRLERTQSLLDVLLRLRFRKGSPCLMKALIRSLLGIS